MDRVARQLGDHRRLGVFCMFVIPPVLARLARSAIGDRSVRHRATPSTQSELEAVKRQSSLSVQSPVASFTSNASTVTLALCELVPAEGGKPITSRSHTFTHSVEPWRDRRNLLLDVSISGELALLLSGGPGLSVPALESIALLDEKVGQRLTIAYRFDNGSRVIGKAFAQADRAGRLARDHEGLWTSGLAVPEPLGLVASATMAVHRRADGVALTRALTDPAAVALVRRAGKWLAALHTATPSLTRTADPADDAAKWATWGEAIDQASTDGAGRARQLALALSARCSELVPAAAVPIHHDFHPGHVLVGDAMTVIDFDEVRMGDRAIDIGHFEAYLHLCAWRDPNVSARLDELVDAFTLGWSTCGAPVADGALAVARAAAYLKIAWQLTLGLGVAPRPVGRERDAQLALALAAGEGSLAHGH